jgi:DNA-3-methyladenine glycosylase II
LRAIGNAGEPPLIVRADQPLKDRLNVSVTGAAGSHTRALMVLREILGLDYDLTQFEQSARRIPWLKGLFGRMKGLKPPRYPSLWEAYVNTIIFQQISIKAASAIALRIIERFGSSIDVGNERVYAFPGANRILDADDASLRATGLSGAKLATLRRAGEAVLAGTLDVAALAAAPAADALNALQQTKGIGPWTATVILIRGIGRLDVFPPNDSSVVANLKLLNSPSGPADIRRLLDVLGPQRGMLYFLLLAARLERDGELDFNTPMRARKAGLWTR